MTGHPPFPEPSGKYPPASKPEKEHDKQKASLPSGSPAPSAEARKAAPVITGKPLLFAVNNPPVANPAAATPHPERTNAGTKPPPVASLPRPPTQAPNQAAPGDSPQSANPPAPARNIVSPSSEAIAAIPAVCIGFRPATTAIAERDAIAQLKKAVDDAPEMLAIFDRPFRYSLDLSLGRKVKLTSAAVSPALAEYGIKIAVDLESGGIRFGGTPLRGFDGDLCFAFRNDGAAAKHYAHVQTKPFFITSDPKTQAQWKDLPVADDEGYPSPDAMARGLPIANNRTIIAASVRGRSHANQGSPRDDHFAMDFDEKSGWGFVAVSDGAGRAKYSRKGAQIACDVTLAALRSILADAPGARPDPDQRENRQREWENRLLEWKEACATANGSLPPEAEAKYRDALQIDAIFHNAIYKAWQAMYDEANHRGAEIDDYHATLLCAAFKRFDFGWFIASYWIGDGGLALLLNDGRRAIVMGNPDTGEFAGETRFLTIRSEIDAAPIRKRMRYTFCDDFEALALMTDGVADPFFPIDGDVASGDRWRQFWRATLPNGNEDNPGCPILFRKEAPPEDKAEALREWLKFRSPGNYDDRTLLVVM